MFKYMNLWVFVFELRTLQYTATVYDTVHDSQLSLLLPRETKSHFANFTFSNEHES